MKFCCADSDCGGNLPSLCKGRWHAKRDGRVVSYKAQAVAANRNVRKQKVSERFSLFRRFKAIEIAVAPVVFACIMPVKGEMIISLS